MCTQDKDQTDDVPKIEESEEAEEMSKEEEFYKQACYNFYLSVSLESIKQQIFLSSGGIGLLATLFLSSHFDNGSAWLWVLAVACFLLVVFLNLFSFPRATKILKNEIREEENSTDEFIAKFLEVSSKTLFVTAIVLSICFLISTKYSITKSDYKDEVRVMAEDNKKKIDDLSEEISDLAKKRKSEHKPNKPIIEYCIEGSFTDSAVNESFAELSSIRPKKKKKKVKK